jgi:hypothetical protein
MRVPRGQLGRDAAVLVLLASLLTLTVRKEMRMAITTTARNSAATLKLKISAADGSERVVRRRHPLAGSILLYVVSNDDEFQRNRLTEMKRALGDDVYVVWDHPTQSVCPFGNVVPCLDIEDDQLSRTRAFNFRGNGLEKAVMWSILHKADSSFKYVWIMEDDVHYTNVSLLPEVLTAPSDADLVHHWPFNESITMKDSWPYAKKVRMSMKRLFGEDAPMYNMMLNLYRMSPAMLRALETVYIRNNRTWVFFEALVPTTAVYFNLTIQDWTKWDPIPYNNFRWRPCFTNFSRPGIYHPAKLRNGTFQKC